MLQQFTSSQWGTVVDWLLSVVGHPWFPWALPPLAVLALILKEFLENPHRAKSDRVALFSISGERIKTTIFDADDSKSSEWEPMVRAWHTEVRTWLAENDSLARAVFFATTVLYDPRMQHLYKDVEISNAKEWPVQMLEGYLKRLNEIQAQYREEDRR